MYWANNHVENLWFDLGVDSYYSHSQLAGNVFSRTTAMEGRRRGALVAPFEFDSVRRQRRLLEGRRLREIERTLGVEVDAAPPPEAAHLLRLCGESDLDFVVIRQAFPGLYAATDDAWFIYDCAALRQRPDAAAYVAAARPTDSPRADAGPCQPVLFVLSYAGDALRGFRRG